MYSLQKYKLAHKKHYHTALKEIRNGQKESHWIWYIFPQIRGLGESTLSQYYAIRNLQEAQKYLEDDYLGNHLLEISCALFQLDCDDISEIFSEVDAMKLKSSMTLFSLVSYDDTIFTAILKKYFNGELDEKTIELAKTSAFKIPFFSHIKRKK